METQDATPHSFLEATSGSLAQPGGPGRGDLSAEVQAIVGRLLGEDALHAESAWDFTVGICNSSFHLLNCVTLHGHERVRGLQQELQRLGYEPISLGTTRQLCGCDLLLVPDCGTSQ